MKITPKILESIYLTLAKCEPFTKWDLPPSELCRFLIVDDHQVMATYEFDENFKVMNKYYLMNDGIKKPVELIKK